MHKNERELTTYVLVERILRRMIFYVYRHSTHCTGNDKGSLHRRFAVWMEIGR